MALAKRLLLTINIADHAGPFSQLAFFCLALPPTLVIAALSQNYLERRSGKFLHTQLQKYPALIGLPSTPDQSRTHYPVPAGNQPLQPPAHF
jgi:hypothetical protein